MTVTSRMCYAMARDKAFPCSEYLSHIHPTLQARVKSRQTVCLSVCPCGLPAPSV